MTRIAIASSDGVNINEHFGRAAFFRIYELDGEEYEFVELRDAIAACQHKYGHSRTNFDSIIALLEDCDAVLVGKIGEGAAAYVIAKGLRVFEVSGSIDGVLSYLINESVFA